MKILKADDLDHHGIVAGTIDELNIVEIIDSLVGVHEDEKITTGEAIKAMIINGLGFTDRPMSLTPQFFENCPVNILFREGVEACDFNRFKLARALDKIHEHGSEAIFVYLAQKIINQEQIDKKYCHLDTTSISVTGKYYEDSDERVVNINYGHSKDHRPDLKQIVLETLVTQDGGVPLICKVWDGNTSDDIIFRERVKSLIETLKEWDNKILIADSKLYSEETAKYLKDIVFVTRIPETIKVTKNIIEMAILKDKWTALSKIDDLKKYQEVRIEHYGIEQRWLVVQSKKKEEQYRESQSKKIKKEAEAISAEIKHLQAERFSCEHDGYKALEEKSRKWKFHEYSGIEAIIHNKYKGVGKPKKNQVPEKVSYQILVKEIKEKTDFISKDVTLSSCYVIGTNASDEQGKAAEILNHYSKEQQKVERGFRFLKDPIFFASSLFLKKPSRIQGLLVVMTISLLVYAIAERKLRQALKAAQETLPNQINKPIKNPTLRWVFQMMSGIKRITVETNNSIEYVWLGLTEIRLKILSFFGKGVQSLYSINTG